MYLCNQILIEALNRDINLDVNEPNVISPQIQNTVILNYYRNQRSNLEDKK